MTDDLSDLDEGAEPEDVLEATSVKPDDSGLSRRRFVQGLIVAGGAAAVGGLAVSLSHDSHHHTASSAPPTTAAGPGPAPGAVGKVGSDDGILLVIMLGGGNDGLNTVVPIGDPKYQALRRNIAIPQSQVLPLHGVTDLGFHPNLTHLQQRYDAGQVAIVRGVGKFDDDHSHFSSMPTWMAGTTGKDRSTGWLGRYSDSLAGADEGFRSMAIGTSVPLHQVGKKVEVTSIPVGDDPFGADRSKLYDSKLFDALAAYGLSTTGRGALADSWGAVANAAMDRATVVAPLYPAKYKVPAGDLTSQLDLAARLINLDLGARVVSAGFATFDQHHNEPHDHGDLLADLDSAIERFYSTLDPKWSKRVTIMTFSEFGRRAAENDSLGTDHGTSSVMFVMGDQVKGGMYGTQPSLTNLDANGDLRVLVDYRSVYATMLHGWMAADPTPVLGAKYPTIDLFKGKPTAS
jgi:uncharacterized protein (DUF1501 family)